MTVAVITPTVFERWEMLVELRDDLTAQTIQPAEWKVGFDVQKVGPGQIRNSLALVASAQWLAFIDDDDRVDPNHLETLLDHSHGADVVYTLGRVEGRPWEIPHDCSHRFAVNTVPMTSLVRAAAFRAVGGFDGDEPEDLSLWRRLKAYGAEFRCVHSVTWTYRFHGTNRSWTPRGR